MSEMVERVARVIFLAMHPNDAWPDSVEEGDFTHNAARWIARAVIKEMDDPTEAMVDYASKNDVPLWPWRHMIHVCLT